MTPSESRYYVLDGLGHTRLLLDNQGTITDTYVYDAWGNALSGTAGSMPNQFTWNGAQRDLSVISETEELMSLLTFYMIDYLAVARREEK